ncbi:MAG: BamA/TamA family outer membrane protein [bacterium]|nr:BamA/TamA family outer membrane protein [bacterium]
MKKQLLYCAMGFLVVMGLTAYVQAQVNPLQGRKLTPIPLLNFSSDDGTGYGLRVNLYNYDGASVPYRTCYSVQAFFSTKGKWAHRFYLDLPNVRPGQRVELEALYEKEDYANYHGGLTDSVLDTYTREQKTFEQKYPKARVTWIKDLRGPWRLRTGLQVGHNSVTPNQEAGNILFDANPRGAKGGANVQTGAALRYDTRDDYNNSASGFLEELLVEYGLGKDFNSGRITYDHRHFLPVGESWVIAHRLNAGLTFGRVPFYEAFDLGGSNTLRGRPAASERGDGRILLNGELRWRGIPISRSRNIYLGLLAFGDAGQVFSRSDGPAMDKWKAGAGAGLRFHWYSTIVRADYGYSEGNTGMYVTFSQVF